jgi:hypothetical protein
MRGLSPLALYFFDARARVEVSGQLADAGRHHAQLRVVPAPDEAAAGCR